VEEREMESEFGCNIENMVMLYHSLIGESMALNDLKKGGIHPNDIEKYGNILKECQEVFKQASDFLGVAEG